MARKHSPLPPRGLLIAGFCLLGSLVTAPQSAQAQSLVDRQIGVGAALHLGGSMEPLNGPGYRHLGASPGFRLHWDKLLGARAKRKVVLGGSLGILGRVLAWQPTEPNRHPGFSAVFDAALRGRFIVGMRDFVLYAGPAVGPSFPSILDERWLGDNHRLGGGLNFTFTALGFEWWWNRNHALFTELGYSGHWLYHDRGLDLHLSQFQTAVGINFAR